MTTASSSTAIPLQALELLGRWNRFVKGFKPYEPSCSCCVGMGIETADDLDVSLLSYLSEKYIGDLVMGDILRTGAGYEMARAGSVVRLLQAFAKRTLDAPESAQQTVLEDIRIALDTAEGVEASASAPAP
ncbi:MAG: hypothetical protein EXR39_09070 [Betaproteobacteria bacterium]|nr:hypothetical protein [Betaproteobacteria bacterium]